MLLELTADEAAVSGAFGDFFEKECTSQVVRNAAELGFDPQLWEHLKEIGATSMALSESLGGGGAGLAELSILAELAGKYIAPVPVVEHCAAARLLEGLELPASIAESLESQNQIFTLALRPAHNKVVKMCPGGAVADAIVAMDEKNLVIDISEPPGKALPNTADMALADRTLTNKPQILASGKDAQNCYAKALAEWQALTAVALCGLGMKALEMTLKYTKERHQFGKPIGAFQAVQHGLADVVVSLEGAYYLAQKAVWALDSIDKNQQEASLRAAAAFLFCAEAAQSAASTGIQYHGGYGYAEEYDIQLYHRRAKGWQLIAGDPSELYQKLADGLLA